MTSHQSLAEWSQWFWPVFANHLLQTTIFIFAVWIAMKFFDRAPARFRYFLWMAAFTKFLIPSAALIWLIAQAGIDLSRPFEAVQTAASTAASGIATAYTETRMIFMTAEPMSHVESPVMANAVAGVMAANHHAEFYCLLTIVWLLGVTAFIVRWLIRRRGFARSLRGAQIITSGREFDALKHVRSCLYVNCEIEIVISSQVREPGLWRVFHPVIVLPEGVAERLSDEELEAVIMHELVHVAHRDNLIGTLQMIVCSALWFHPLAWLIDRRMLAEREIWCDEKVIRLTGEPELYAASLWKVTRFGMGWPVAGVSRVAGSNLKRRLEHMLTMNTHVKMTTARRAAAYASFLALALLSVSLGLSDISAFAQRNKIEAADDAVLAEGLKDRVEVGKPDGVISGVIGSLNRKAPAESASGALTGMDGARADQTVTQDNKGYAESLRPNRFELIKQLPGFPIQIENQINAPLLITNARVRVRGEEENQVYSNGRVAENTDNIISQFNITLVNQTDRLIKDVILEIKNPGLARTGLLIGLSGRPIGLSGMPKDTIAGSQNRVIEPHASYILDEPILIVQRRVLDGISDLATRFMIRVVGVKFESGTHWGDVTSMQEDTNPTDFASIETVSSKPKILYKEIPRYTPEARDNRVEGTVVLSVLFRSDGGVTDIKVVHGLPDGLTQKAIEAAKSIQFEPAIKNGRPVSVRSIVEFRFSVYQGQTDKNL